MMGRMPKLPLPEPGDYSHPTNYGHPSGQTPLTAEPEESTVPDVEVATSEGDVTDPVPTPAEDSPRSEAVESAPEIASEPVAMDPGTVPGPATIETPNPEQAPAEVEITPYPPAAPTVSGVDVTADVNLK